MSPGSSRRAGPAPDPSIETTTMCLGVPGLIVERDDPADDLPWALVEFAGVRRKVCIACVPECRPGDYVIVHAGIAISLIDPDEAARTLELLDRFGETDGWDQDQPTIWGGPRR